MGGQKPAAAAPFFTNSSALWSTPVECQGYASKRSRGVKSWNNRWCVVKVSCRCAKPIGSVSTTVLLGRAEVALGWALASGCGRHSPHCCGVQGSLLFYFRDDLMNTCKGVVPLEGALVRRSPPSAAQRWQCRAALLHRAGPGCQQSSHLQTPAVRAQLAHCRGAGGGCELPDSYMSCRPPTTTVNVERPDPD